jgi:hypothetical protein
LQYCVLFSLAMSFKKLPTSKKQIWGNYIL